MGHYAAEKEKNRAPEDAEDAVEALDWADFLLNMFRQQPGRDPGKSDWCLMRLASAYRSSEARVKELEDAKGGFVDDLMKREDEVAALTRQMEGMRGALADALNKLEAFEADGKTVIMGSSVTIKKGRAALVRRLTDPKEEHRP